MEQSSADVQILTKLGEGAYGCVYKAIMTNIGLVIAIKVIKITPEDEGLPSTTLREISILKSLTHKNIVKLLHVKVETQSPNPRIELFFEFMDQDLAKFIKRNNKKVEQKVAKKIMKQILQGVHYMHEKRVFHRDLKPQNILINQHLEVKIADFGLGRIVGPKLDTMSKEIETLWYRAPELLFGTTNYDFAVDTWSLGCIFYELCQGSVLFQTQSEIGQIMQIMRQLGTPKVEDWPQITNFQFFRPSFPKFTKIEREYKTLSVQGANLLESFIMVNPLHRTKIVEALGHPYFDSY